MKKYIRRLILLFLLLFAVIWLISWGKCEIYTKIYGSQFENLVVDGADMGDNLRVIYFSDDYAEVYYFGGARSDYLAFRSRGKSWIVNRHRVIRYAEDRSAREFVWPYFWHYIITE